MTPAPLFDNWIGRREVFEPDTITPRLCQEFAATFGDALAQVPGAAPGLQWCIAPTIANTAMLGRDGHPVKGSFLPPIPLPSRMWASGSLEFRQPLMPGDTVQKISTIKGIEWKAGRSGKLCFVAVTTDYAIDRGIAIRENQHIVYREAQKVLSIAVAPEPAYPQFDIERRVEIIPALLFRYSALTFNSHRIHYDLPYAREEEGYPDLVIHGPLQASLLLNLATSAKSVLPKYFEFRAVSPATGSQTLKTGAIVEDNDCYLQVVSGDNVVTMTAYAKW